MIRFIRAPSLRLPDEKIERHATWLELFFDLIYVAIITELAARLTHNLSYLGILQCSALFFPIMWTWASYTVFAARFDNSDFIHWLMTFVIMFAGVIMAIQIPVALEDGAQGFTIGFLISQISILLLYSRAYYDDSTPHNIILLYVIGFGLATTFWLISLFFEPPIKFYCWILGMMIYLLVPWIGKKKILSQAPLDTRYIPERFGLFIIIILGQTIASVVIGLKSAHWNFFSVITGTMAFILAIIIWGQYYRFIQIADYRCTLSSGQSYIYSHIPLIISLIIIGVCAEDFIKNPIQTHEHVSIIFCLAIILYLTSFYLLQYIAIGEFKIRGLVYLGGVTAILILFFLYPLSAMITMSGIALIFAILFSIQYWLGKQILKSS